MEIDVQRLSQSLGRLPERVDRPAFIVLSGLPGTGKSYFSHQLELFLPVIILESDALRKTLFSNPTYSGYENARLFSAIHILIEKLLKQGVSVLLDSTNLSERNRKKLYNIAERTNAIFILVRLKVSEPVIRKRLNDRIKYPSGYSDADWEVYKRMKAGSEKIRHKHFVVDSGKDILPMINNIVSEVSKERNEHGN